MTQYLSELDFLVVEKHFSVLTFSRAGSSKESSCRVTGTWARILSFTASSRACSWAGATLAVSSSMLLRWRPSSLEAGAQSQGAWYNHLIVALI